MEKKRISVFKIFQKIIDIVRAKKETGKIIIIGFQPRFEKDMKLVKKVVSPGVLDKIYYIQTGGENTNCFEHKIRSFLDAIHTNGKAPIPTSEIIYNQAIIDHIIKSAKVGHELPVEIPEI